MIIDLSMPVSEKTIVFPGDAKPVFEPAGTLEKEGFIDHIVHINNHLGTHIDAPGHMLAGGKTLESYPIDRFVCDAICIDARGKDLMTADLLTTPTSVELRPGMAVLFYSGRGDDYTTPEYATDYPTIDSSLAKHLIEKGVSMVGIDMIGFDREEGSPIHKLLLGKDILLFENLINLDKIVGKRFRLYALPLRLELQAAPARVIAVL